MWPTARAGLGLADADAEQPLAARGDRQPPVLQRVGAEVLDRAGRPVEDELGEDRARHVGARELLEHDRGLDVAEPGAAPLLADRDAEQLGLAHARPTPTAGTPRSRRRGGPSARARARRRRGRAAAARPGPRCRRTDSRPARAQTCGAGYRRSSRLEEHVHRGLDHEQDAAPMSAASRPSRPSTSLLALALRLPRWVSARDGHLETDYRAGMAVEMRSRWLDWLQPSPTGAGRGPAPSAR